MDKQCAEILIKRGIKPTRKLVVKELNGKATAIKERKECQEICDEAIKAASKRK